MGWWAGAGLLAAGNVVIGRREEAEKPGGTTGLDVTTQEAEESENLLRDEQEDLMELRESFEGGRNTVSGTRQSRPRPIDDIDNPI